MISKKTVFVLGAGASKPFGFPTGYELKKEICLLHKEESAASNLLKECGYLPNASFNSFIDAFLTSGLYSIDAFLSRNEHFSDFGTAAIAACLLTKESLEKLYHAGGAIADSDWYGLLWNCLVDQIQHADYLSPKNDVSFITFNYDRSLEAFLLRSSMTTFGIGSESAFEINGNLKIHHMYGLLDKVDRANCLNYGISDDPLTRKERLLLAARDIKVVPAQRREEVDLTAQKMLDEAQQIVFLGFGFDATNCARLGLPDVLKKALDSGLTRSVFMTAVGMTDHEINRAMKLIAGPAEDWKYSIEVRPHSCYQSLREWGILNG